MSAPTGHPYTPSRRVQVPDPEFLTRIELKDYTPRRAAVLPPPDGIELGDLPAAPVYQRKTKFDVQVPFDAPPPQFPPPPVPQSSSVPQSSFPAERAPAAANVLVAPASLDASVAITPPTSAAPPPTSAAPPPTSAVARFFDALFHHHAPQGDAHAADDADLPDYDSPAVAPLVAAVKAGITAAAPFAFLNYLLLLTILYDNARSLRFVIGFALCFEGQMPPLLRRTMLFPFGSDGHMRRYGANYRASFNSFNTRIVFCDHDGGAEAIALFQSFVSVTSPAPNPGVFATVQKISCSSVDDLKSTVLAHASHPSTGKDTVVGGVYVPAAFTSNVRGFELGNATSITSRVTTIADEGYNPSFMNRAVNPVFTASVAHYNAIKANSFWKATLDAGIVAAAASFPGSAARQSLLTPVQITAVRLNTASPIGSLASTLGVIFLFVQAQVALMMIHPIIMPLFGKIKFRHYINIRRAIAYGMTTCFAFIAAALTAIFGTFNAYIDGRIWICLFLSAWLVITTFGLSISFCQFMFGPLAPTAIGIFMALNVASAQFDAPWACLPDFFQIGRALAMPNGVELIRCVLFGSCYNIGANIGVLLANQVLMTLVLSALAKSAFMSKVHGERMQKLGQLVGPAAAPPANQQGAMYAGLGMAITAH